MTDKECNKILAKAKAVHECIENIDEHDEWICHINEELEKLNVMKPRLIKVLGCTKEEGDTCVSIPLSKKEEVMELIKEKLEKAIQEHEKSISNEYEKLNSLLK
jgi:hypothetical protein|nr:MAG TPA: hypothetical protein [Caudoviricetes sp.]